MYTLLMQVQQQVSRMEGQVLSLYTRWEEAKPAGVPFGISPSNTPSPLHILTP